MKCKKCNSPTHTYKFVKCLNCGMVIENFFKGFSPDHKGWKLKITIEPKEDEIWIRGNKGGLEYLASCCLSVIGKTDPSGHILLQWQMNNLLEESKETRLEFSDDEEDYKD